ncbi:MAG: hypothetical protein ACLFV7_00805 [Phycisphaerae bacterium]
MSNGKRNNENRRGAAYVMAVIVICVLASMAAFLINATDLNVQKSDNFRQMFQAQSAAESGLGFLTYKLSQVSMSSTTDEENLLENLASELSMNMDGNYGWSSEQTVSVTNGKLVIPVIYVDQSSFWGEIEIIDAPYDVRCRLTVTGVAGIATHRGSAEFSLSGSSPSVFSYAMASKGRIELGSNAAVVDATDGNTADLLVMKDDPESLYVDGSATVDGELFVTDDKSSVVYIGGNGEVHGEADVDAAMENYVHEVADPPFPDIDITEFTSAVDLSAGDVVDNTTDLNQSVTLNNVTITSGTNPDFKKDTVLNGVIYIESPNHVNFKSDVQINGVIVTQPKDDLSPEECSITFKSKAALNGIEALDTTDPQFVGLAGKTGTALLAEGYRLEFHGSSDSYNGTVAADDIAFYGNTTGGTGSRGTFLGLNEDYGIEFLGVSQLLVNRTLEEGQVPAGFVYPNTPKTLILMSMRYDQP